VIESSAIVRRFVRVPLFVSDYALKYKARLYSKQKGMSRRKGSRRENSLPADISSSHAIAAAQIQELG
jgi:hypothetical protein